MSPMNTHPQNQWLTEDPVVRPSAAAQYTGVTEGTLRMRRYRGLPPTFLKPTPKTVLYRKSDLDSWLASSERTITEMGK